MVHLVQFIDPGDKSAEIAQAQQKLRGHSYRYFPLSAVSALVANDLPASTLAERIQRRTPGVQVLAIRVRNSWQAFGCKDLVAWLEDAVSDF